MAKHAPKKSPPGIKLGSVVKDRITGFTGVAISRTEFAYGCVHICVQPARLTKNGDAVPAEAFDDQRVQVLSGPTVDFPEAQKSKIRLGDNVRDIVTGASGTATARIVGLDGRISFMIEVAGQTADSELKPALVMTDARLEVLNRGRLRVSSTSTATSGGPAVRSARWCD